MRICIDARWIFPEISGIGAYTRELISHLRTIDSKNEYVLLFCDAAVMERTIRETGLDGAQNFSCRLVDYGVFSIAGQLRLPGMLKKEHLDVYHSTNYMMPFPGFPARAGCRCVITVHDVIPMIFPHLVPCSKKARLYPLYNYIMKLAGRKADVIITDSYASKTDILKHMRIKDPTKVKPVYCGVSERFRPRSEEPSESPDRTRTLLYVGRSDPYKNLTAVIRALPAIRKQCPFKVRLTVAGSPDPRYPEAQLIAKELGVVDAVNWTGYLPDDQLMSLYHTADVLVHPSMYEGFGLQVLEAMASGLPVVCSNAAALPEVTGDAALLVDPLNGDELVARTVEVLSNQTLRRELSAKGVERAADFTWSKTAADTLAIYEGLCR